MNTKMTVTKSNNLIDGECFYEPKTGDGKIVTGRQEKLLLYFISLIDSNNDDVNKEYSVSYDSLREFVKFDRDSILKGAIEAVCGISFKIETFKLHVIIPSVFTILKMDDTCREFHFKLNSEIAPFLFNLKNIENGFTKYRLKNIWGLKNLREIKLYEMLKRWENSKTGYAIKLDRFKSKFGYSQDSEWQNISRALKKALKNIEKNTDISVNFKGRSENGSKGVKNIQFNVKKKQKVSRLNTVNPSGSGCSETSQEQLDKMQQNINDIIEG